MKIKLAFNIFLFFTLAGHIPLVEEFPKHPEYFKNYFLKFDQYFKENFPDFSKGITPEKFKKLLNSANHWNTENDDRVFSWNVIYDVKTDSLSYSFTQGEDELVKETVKNLEENLEGFPLTQRGKFLFLPFVEKASLHRDKNGGITRIDFTLNDVQVEWFPEKLKKIIYKIGYDTRLPADKISITKKGEIYVRYP